MRRCVLVYNKDRNIITARESIDYIKSAIIDLGYTCKLIPFDRDFIYNIEREAPDVVFNYYTGTCYSQVIVPSILEELGIRYTGSGPLTQAIAIDKEYTSVVLRFYEVPVPDFFTVKGGDVYFPLRYPLIVKPALGGSSEGISSSAIVFNKVELDKRLEELFSEGFNKILVSSFIKGRELTVGVIGTEDPEVLGILETRMKPDEILTEKLKEELDVYDERVVVYSGRYLDYIKEVALKAYNVLNCKGYARIDIRLSEDGVPYMIDINALPGLHPRYSYLPRMAEVSNLGYKGLIEKIIENC